MNDNLNLATFIATVLNLEVNIKILDVSNKILQANIERLDKADKQEALLGEIVNLLKSK